MWRFALALCLTTMGFHSPAFAETSGRILAIGDSLLATHARSGRSIPDVVAQQLGAPVTNRSVVAARHIYKLPISGALGFRIASQYRPGPWKWVIMNGGGNDLWLGCNCNRCDKRMNQMIGKNGTGGEIGSLVSRVRASGARVVYVGYLRSPGRGSPIEHCRNEGAELERRIAAMAKRDKGIWFVSLKDLVPRGDRSFHATDMIHPSYKGSAAIAARVAKVIKKAGR